MDFCCKELMNTLKSTAFPVKYSKANRDYYWESASLDSGIADYKLSTVLELEFIPKMFTTDKWWKRRKL